MSEFKKGDIVRYSPGCTALVRLDTPHAGGWHGVHCLGGYHFVSGPNMKAATPEDEADYERYRAETLRIQSRSS